MLSILHKVARAVIAIIGHALLASVLIVCWRLIERLILYLGNGREMMIYGQIPLSYLFQTGTSP